MVSSLNSHLPTIPTLSAQECHLLSPCHQYTPSVHTPSHLLSRQPLHSERRVSSLNSHLPTILLYSAQECHPRSWLWMKMFLLVKRTYCILYNVMFAQRYSLHPVHPSLHILRIWRKLHTGFYHHWITFYCYKDCQVANKCVITRTWDIISTEDIFTLSKVR
jgi:hypothetical protein